MSDSSGCNHSEMVRSHKIPTPMECAQCGKLEVAVLKSKVFSLERAHEGLLGIIEGLQDHIAVRDARIEALTAEVEEQARLLGASGSREAELLARIEALEKAAKAVCISLAWVDKHTDFEGADALGILAALLQEPTK